MKSSPPPSGLDECLRLLRGPRDEQRLAGLLVASKLCKSDDYDSVLKVCSAVGPRFLDRLLMTGMGKVGGNSEGGEDREAYLRLAVTVLAAFARVPEIASSEDMLSRIPIAAEIIAKQSDPSIYEECYEFLLSVAAASENAIIRFYEPGVMSMLAPHISGLQDGSKSLELSMRLLQLVLNKLPVDMMDSECLRGISLMVVSIARQFCVLHSVLKFDALHMLTALLSSKDTRLFEALRSMPSEVWGAHVRVGIREILQNRVVSAEKLQALLLAEAMMSILGEEWLLEQSELHDVEEHMTVDKFLLLVLESSRVEVAVLLNEIAYLKYEASKSSSATSESIPMKQQNLFIAYSLIEKIIKLVSNVCVSEGSCIKESTLHKVIAGLNETIGLVLDFLQDSKDHGQRRGDDLLASVRIIGSYLAETPYACKEKTRHLLEYMLSVEGEEESSPFYSVCFLLPMLCQITMEIDGCKTLVSFGGHKAIVDCLVKMISQDGAMVENNGTIFLACDTIMNILLNRSKLQACLEGLEFVELLKALTLWTNGNDDPSVIMMASSICSLVFELTSEESLLKHPTFDSHILQSLSQVIQRSLNQGDVCNDGVQHVDLHQIISEGYTRWADRFPLTRSVVKNAMSL